VASNISSRPSFACSITVAAFVSGETRIAMMQWLNWLGDAHSLRTIRRIARIDDHGVRLDLHHLSIARIIFALSLQSP
jgi:hypothetical protein